MHHNGIPAPLMRPSPPAWSPGGGGDSSAAFALSMPLPTVTAVPRKIRSKTIWTVTATRASWSAACTSPNPTVASVLTVKYSASVLVCRSAISP
jgi:hypothetical protein